MVSQCCFGVEVNPLIGKWVLDKERTIKYARENGVLNEENHRIWSQSKTILEFTQTNYIANYGGDVVSGSYQIVGLNENQITIVYNNTSTKNTVYLVNKGFYLELNETKNAREYYRKIE